jgi:hypothetical protein
MAIHKELKIQVIINTPGALHAIIGKGKTEVWFGGELIARDPREIAELVEFVKAVEKAVQDSSMLHESIEEGLRRSNHELSPSVGPFEHVQRFSPMNVVDPLHLLKVEKKL